MFTILKISDDFILIDKEPNVNFHKVGSETSIIDALRRTSGINELFPVHRLDFITSGLLLFARTPDFAKDFSSQLQNHETSKFYLALSDSKPKKKQGLIKGDMVKSRNGTWILQRTHTNPAATRFYSAGMGDGLRLFLLRPFTGKTHQLRVALKSLGAPVFGDPLYGSAQKSAKADRAYLHSFALSFKVNGVLQKFTQLPSYGEYFTNTKFIETVTKFLNPWALQWPPV